MQHHAGSGVGRPLYRVDGVYMVDGFYRVDGVYRVHRVDGVA